MRENREAIVQIPGYPKAVSPAGLTEARLPRLGGRDEAPIAGRDGGVKTLKEIVRQIESSVPCKCDLDRWEPEKSTGHSWVCPIHKAAIAVRDAIAKPAPAPQDGREAKE